MQQHQRINEKCSQVYHIGLQWLVLHDLYKMLVCKREWGVKKKYGETGNLLVINERKVERCKIKESKKKGACVCIKRLIKFLN